MTDYRIQVGDRVRVGAKGKVEYTVIERVDELNVRIKSDKRTINADDLSLTVIKRVEPEVEAVETTLQDFRDAAAEVTKKVSWIKRASRRIKGKRGRSGKLRNA